MSVKRETWKIFISSWVSKAGLALLLILIITSIYVLITYPLDYGLRIWNNPKAWTDNPRSVPPEWVDIFSNEPLLPHSVISVYEPEDKFFRLERLYQIYKIEYDLEIERYPTIILLKIFDVVVNSEIGVIFEINLTKPNGDTIFLSRFSEVIPEGAEFPLTLYSEEPKLVYISSDKDIAVKLSAYVSDKYNLNITPGDVLNKYGQIKVLFGEPVEVDGEIEWKPMTGKYVFTIVMIGSNGDTLGEARLIIGGEKYGLLGTDSSGRDLAEGLLFGFPIALLIGVVTSLITTGIGTSLGIISGYKGGRTDEIIQRVADIIYNFPVLPLLILIVFIISTIPDFPKLVAIIGALVAFGWPGLTILIRSMVLTLKKSQFVEAAKAIGASDFRIMFKHIFPNIAPFVFAQMIFFTPGAILAEAALSFLGLGDPSLPTWGQIIEQAFNAGAITNGWWWWIIPPGALIMLSAITFVFLALGMEPIVNPKLQER